MRKNKAKATAKVDAFLAEPFANDEARMERIIEQAKAESFRRAAEQPENAKKKGLWRGAPALCALVIILIVAPIIAVIVNPVSFSKANQLVRKATVWVNDTFKLNIELPVEDEQNSIIKEGQRKTFSTIEEATAYLGKNILVLEETDENGLISIEIVDYPGIEFITQNYEYKGNQVMLTIETVYERFVDVPKEEAINVPCNVGTLWMWTNDNLYRAVGVVGDWAIDLCASTDTEDVEKLFGSLNWFN